MTPLDRTTPYGAWSSPITTDLLVAGAVGLHEVQADGEDLWWDEGRPEEGGRIQLVRRTPDGATTDVLPDGFAARTRVHEYGGGGWRVHEGVLFFSNWSDQRLHRLDPGGEPRPLTPEGCRYADMDVAPDGTWLVAVREDHRGEGEARNEIVRIDTTTGDETVLVTGPDFVASPRLDGLARGAVGLDPVEPPGHALGRRRGVDRRAGWDRAHGGRAAGRRGGRVGLAAGLGRRSPLAHQRP